MSEELKPCPFCGGEVRLMSSMMRSDNWVVCRSCDVYYPVDSRRELTEAEILPGLRREGGGAMSFGEGNLRERVRKLEDELSEAQGTCESLADENVELHWQVEGLKQTANVANRALRASAAVHQAKDERIAALESLARGMAGLLHGICREGWTIDQARVSELLDAASGLGIDAESEES